MNAIQSGPITLHTPFGDDVTFRAMDGREAISESFEYTLDVVSTQADLKAADVLNVAVTVQLERTDGAPQPRYWNGRVTEFQYLGTGDDGYSRYRFVVRAWLWYLSQGADCRVFQAMSVPDVIAKVFQDRGFSDFETALFEGYQSREYVVQYRETDLAFVSRLMESEGIYYFFRHEANRHVLVLADSPSAHDPEPGCDTLAVAARDPHRDATTQYIRQWQALTALATSRFTHTDYDFRGPRTPLEVTRAASDRGASPDWERYDYPGGYTSTDVGEIYARVRVEQCRAGVQRWEGESNARGLTVGATFAVDHYERFDQNRKYLVIGADYHIRGQDVLTSPGATDEPFSCAFQAISADAVFRTPYKTPKQVARGPLTAVVVGPDGQEIWTDNFGRIKVQFHWDRTGKRDQTSSCWMRVAQAWAGTGFGVQFIPRIGQEVLVDFLDGDPDRPLVTGCVYNGTHDLPFKLPNNQTQSGVRTRSSPGGMLSTGNEIRFEDAIGAEELFVQAEKDMNFLVKNDETVTIVNDRTDAVGVDEQRSVGANRTRSVGINESVSVGAIQAVTVGAAQTVTVGAMQTVTVGAAQAVTVGAVQSVTVGAEQTVAVAADRTLTVGGNESTTVSGDRSIKVGGDLQRTVTGDVSAETSGKTDQTFTLDYTERHLGHRTVIVGTGDARRSSVVHVEGKGRAYASKSFEVEVLEGFTLLCGDSQIAVTPSGITLTSPNISLVGKEVDIIADALKATVTSDLMMGAKTVTLQTAGAKIALDASSANVTASQVKLAGGSGSSSQTTSEPVKVTKVQMKDPQGKPRANARVLLTKGDEQRMTVLDADGMLELIGDASYTVSFPDDGKTK
ncbi:MAG: type VI secretion system tip protein TssI/VgrG [Polyangiaceae bacterium]|jgi:type VI secretion system secreted protein VgrG